MAISVQIPKEITEYEEKIMFGMSLRKLVCFGTAIILAIASYFLCTKLIGLSMDATGYVIIVEAMPLMAMGFIRKDGMNFEQYAALIIRHKVGRNRLLYENELVVDSLPDPAEKAVERKSKYAWIFEKENGNSGNKLSRKERNNARNRREAEVFEVTKKGRESKRKAALCEIKAARQDYRAIKRRAEKEAKEKRRAEKHRRANPV